MKPNIHRLREIFPTATVLALVCALVVSEDSCSRAVTILCDDIIPKRVSVTGFAVDEGVIEGSVDSALALLTSGGAAPPTVLGQPVEQKKGHEGQISCEIGGCNSFSHMADMARHLEEVHGGLELCHEPECNWHGTVQGERLQDHKLKTHAKIGGGKF
jgi:hypothetical protein